MTLDANSALKVLLRDGDLQTMVRAAPPATAAVTVASLCCSCHSTYAASARWGMGDGGWERRGVGWGGGGGVMCMRTSFMVVIVNSCDDTTRLAWQGATSAVFPSAEVVWTCSWQEK